MEADIGDLLFAVELKLQLSQLSFGQHEGIGIIDPPSDFSELDTLGAPVFLGRCFFGRNNLGNTLTKILALIANVMVAKKQESLTEYWEEPLTMTRQFIHSLEYTRRMKDAHKSRFF